MNIIQLRIQTEPTEYLISQRLNQLIQFYDRDKVLHTLKTGLDPFNSMLEVHLCNLKAFDPNAFAEVLSIVFPEQYFNTPKAKRRSAKVSL